MAEENGLGGKRSTDEAETSKGKAEAEKRSAIVTDQGDSKKSKGGEKTNTVPFHKLFSFADSTDILLMIVGTIGAIVNGMSMPLMALLFGELSDSFGMNQNDKVVGAVSKVSLKFVYLALGSAVGAFFQVACWMVTGERQAASIRSLYLKAILRQDITFYDKETKTGEVVGRMSGCKLIQCIRVMCFEKVVHMEVGWFDEPEHSSGAIGARLSADAASVRALVGDALGQLVEAAASAVVGLVIAFVASWQLSLIVLILIPLIGVNGFLQMKFLKGFSEDAKMKYEEASQVANDAVGGIRTIASFCAEDKVMQLYKRKCEGPMKTGIRQGLISGVGYGLSFFLLFSVYATIFYAGARLVEKGKATLSDVFRVFFGLTMAAIGISQSSAFAPDYSKARNAAGSIFAIVDKKSKIDPSDESGMKLDDVKGEIELRSVSFKYPSRPDIQIFQDLNLTIHSSKTVALVGESGSGKSTVISLLQRFYHPDSGHITLDGTEIQKFQLKWLRQQMGLVSQEPVLFNDTIRTNIAYGKEGSATETEIIAASELANAHKFVSSLQQGYDMVVGERGVQLSGGQKQRVAIARAIMKSPKILLLDEATSALDAESEKLVQDALDRVVVNKTTVVVTHRLSTIKNAELIAVIKNGMIVEKGKHETLINIKDGFYASLVALHSNAPTTRASFINL